MGFKRLVLICFLIMTLSQIISKLPHAYAEDDNTNQLLLKWYATDPNLGHNVGKAVDGIWTADSAVDSSGYLSFGPYLNTLKQGVYSATWSLQINDNTTNNHNILRLEVYDVLTNNLISYRNITREEFIKPGVFQDFNVEFPEWGTERSLEFRCFWYGESQVKLKEILLINTSIIEGYQYDAVNDSIFGHNVGRKNGDFWTANITQDSAGFLSFGPYETRLDPGEWTVVWTMMIDNNSINNDNVARVEIYDPDSNTFIAEKIISRKDFELASTLQDFKVSFKNIYPGSRLEYRFFWYDTAQISLKSICAYKQELVHYTYKWNAQDSVISHRIGRPDELGWSATVGQDSPGYLSFGPYQSALPEGNWNARWYLKIDDIHASQEAVVRIEVYDVDSNAVLKYRDIGRQEFLRENQFQDFNINFYVDNPSHRLELRTNWFGISYVQLQDLVLANLTTNSVKGKYYYNWKGNNSALLHDTGRVDGIGWLVAEDKDAEGYMNYGPYLTNLEPGHWIATWNVKSLEWNDSETPVIRLEVYDTDQGELLASQNIERKDHQKAIQDFSLQFFTSNPNHRLEFRTYWYGQGELQLQNISLTNISNDLFNKTWNVIGPAIGHRIGRENQNGWSVNVDQDQEHFMSFGPYESHLSKGPWTISWTLSIGHNWGADKVLRLEVYEVDSNTILAQREVLSNEFLISNQLQSFNLEFDNNNHGQRLEFRVYWYDTAQITLQKITAYSSVLKKTEFMYDSSNHLRAIILPNETGVYMQYDKNGNIVYTRVKR